MFYEDDIDSFFEDFGQDVVWTHGSVSMTISAIIDMPGAIQKISGVAIQVQSISATIKTADISGITQSDTITFDSTVYKITEILPDGTGITRLTLATGTR